VSSLYTKSCIEETPDQLEHWQWSAFNHFSSMMLDEDHPYPCLPGKQGFLANSLRFGFVGDPRNNTSIKNLAHLLQTYGDISRDTGKYASLVIFFDSRELEKDFADVDRYQTLFWSILSQVHEQDAKPWPEGIPEDPSHHEWEFCFDGEPYFSFCATPAHTQRKSRSFPYFMLTFQPRWVFDELNDSTTRGRKMKKVIRERLESYDGMAPHPDLKWYGQKDNHEWKQYFLHDDESTPSKCPFMRMKEKFKGLGIKKS